MRTKSSLIRPTVRRRKAKGNRKTVQPFVMVLNCETIRKKASVLRAFPPVSYGRAKTAIERENEKRERKNATSISSGLKERAKTVERERTKRNTKNATSVSSGLKEKAKTVERERKKYATQGGEARGLA